MGALASNLITPALISAYNWESSFYLFALLPPLVWLPLWTTFLNLKKRRNLSRIDLSRTPLMISDEIKLRYVDTGDMMHSYDSIEGTAIGNITTTIDNINNIIVNNNNSNSSMIAVFSDDDKTGSSNDASTPSLKITTHSSTYKASIMELLQQKPVWAIIAAQYGQSWGLYGLLSWLPTYYSDRFHVPLVDLGSFTALPYLLQSIVSIYAGFIADALVNKYQWRVLTVRNLLQTIGMITPAICLTYSAYGPLIESTIRSLMSMTSSSSTALLSSSAAALVSSTTTLVSPTVTAAIITIGSAASALTSAAVSCNQFDISPQNSGTIFGIANTAACIAALIAVPISGALFDTTHSWDAVFILFAIHYVIGNILWLLWSSDQPLVFTNSHHPST